MGLADLKKNATSCDNQFSKQMSVDEFIETASLYALGKTHEFDNANNGTNVVDFINRLSKQKAEANIAVEQSNAPFRRATFTLSEQAISQLGQFSQQSKLAKSKLIRHLINEHHQLTEQEKQTLYQKFELQTS
ncbi:CopG family transcriptional regulator [Shewanella gaetbuli]|uniref:CopG family transcriptional regulator n=1 Tax=Shewanella gaetbuli TaxID=220752 RepID=A0A9X2CJ81_9GAMM|nr:CopG family transcriptional regulator [Shewanella gaetbuli]MCL1141766.1 CopG family transcriptional regulator [Shewanella gaetbuli]